MGRRKVRLALTVGDPAGIGPEIIASLLARTDSIEHAEIVCIGSAAALLGCDPRIADICRVVGADEVAAGAAFGPEPLLIDAGSGAEVPRGGPTAEGGRISAESIEIAARLARDGIIEGLVTGPISKEALHLAGSPYTGHTEMLAALLGAPGCQMIMVAGDFRVLILTRHIPLGAVPSSLGGGTIERGIEVAHRALVGDFGIAAPRIAVAALNPHAGDGGVIGGEDDTIVAPAIERARGMGLDVAGPFPADSLFHPERRRGYDLIVALYHDQGMIPFKAAAFDRGVNVTVGLPIVRTSVCHGTAYDIAGAGAASPRSLEEAFGLAVRCCEARRRRS